MRVLHMASFNGNIGDHANHNGFRQEMRKYIDSKIEFVNLEIREFYKSWGLRKFDDELVNFINEFDLFVLGGGNFFDIRWEYSVTGTTIDMSVEQLRKIKCPILINGIGIDDNFGHASKENLDKFGIFFSELIDNPKCFFTTRNDGSKEIAQKYYGNIADKILQIPDGGFFVKPKQFYHVEIPNNRITVAINLAGDLENIRFSQDGKDGRLTKNEFLDEFAEFINQTLETNSLLSFIFVPHIPSDLREIQKVLQKVKDCYIRTRITVAPYLNGDITNADYIFDLYKSVDLVIGMRYHANVCPIGVKTPTISIVNLEKHRLLYKDIGMGERLVQSDLKGFSSVLSAKLNEYLPRLDVLRNENIQLIEKLEKQNERYFLQLKEFLDNNLN